MKLAFISLTSCEGCFYNLISSQLFTLLEKYSAKVVYWRMLGIAEEDKDCDIAVVEGSVTTEQDVELVKRVRERARLLIAVGSCSLLGGVQSGIGEKRSLPIHHYVKVDYYIRGCPIKPQEFLDILEKLLRGERPRIGERRFGLVERPVIVVRDSRGVLTLDSAKCIVCGRCIELCSKVGAHVLNYVNRGIHTLVSTPFHREFDKAGCVYCGLCTAYCPVGALYFSLEPQKIKRYLGSPVYIEPEALAALAEAEKLSIWQVVSALRVLGFSEIIVYTPLSSASPGEVYTRSPAEQAIVARYMPSAKTKLLAPHIPSHALYITQCLAWRLSLPNAITAREMQMMLRTLNYSLLSEERPNAVIMDNDKEIQLVGTVNELRTLLARPDKKSAVVFEVCPGGCLMGGGQPVSSEKLWGEVLAERSKIMAILKP